MPLAADRLEELDAFLLELNRAAAGGHPAAVPRRPRPGGQGRGQGRGLRPRHRGRQGRRGGDPQADRRALSRPRRHRRGVRRGSPGRRLRLGARPGRRHPGLHRRPAAVDHPDRPAPSKAARCSARSASPILGELLHRPRRRLAPDGARRTDAARPCAPAPSLTDAIIATTDADACFNAAELGAWTQLRAAARLARFGCDAYAYAMVAPGTMDLVVEAGLKSWDVEAAIPADRRRRRRRHRLDAAQPIGRDGGQMALAGDPACLDAALDFCYRRPRSKPSSRYPARRLEGFVARTPPGCRRSPG